MKHDEHADIQRLLRLKRHETPPPGYFRDFSTGVLARIRREGSRPKPSLWGFLTTPWQGSARLAWANGLTLAGLGVVAFSLYLSSVTPGKPGLAVTPADPQLGGVGIHFAPPSYGQTSPSSLLTVSEPMVPDGVRLANFGEGSSTNPLPEGLFQLPGSSGHEAIRVRFGGPR